MFDLNLINNPGLQKFDKNEDKLENNNKNKVKDYKKKEMKIKIRILLKSFLLLYFLLL